MEALVLAGNVAPPSLRELGVERIYLLKSGGETLLARICRCLIAGGGASRVWVLTPEEVELPDVPGVMRANYSGSPMHDLIECVKHNCTDDDLLVSSADMPAVTPDAVQALADFAREREVDGIYHIVDRAAVERDYPGTERTYLKLRSGSYTGGNVFYLRRSWLVNTEDLLTELFANRKNIPALAARFGIGFLLKVLLGLADVPYLEQHLGRVFNARIAAAPLPYPGLAVDLDKLEDLELFRPLLDPLPRPDEAAD